MDFGAAAKQLRANVSVSLSNARTKFNILKDYIFKDPVNSFNNEYSNVIFDGDLDDNGQVSISQILMSQAKCQVF